MQKKPLKPTQTAVTPSGALMSTLDASVPVGAGIRALDADVSGQISEAAPTFGNLLSSVGNSVAISQELLDKSIVETVNALSATTIDVITEVVLQLDDDGMPMTPTSDDLKTSKVSVINYFWPTVHEWKKVALSMDLSVSSFHSEHGMTFYKKQRSSETHAVGLFWGFVGWLDTDDQTKTNYSSRSSTYDQDWANGQIRMDAQLGPRRTTKFPTPTQVSVGPQVFITPGAITEKKTGQVITERTSDLYIKVLKADGANNPQKQITVTAGSFMVEPVDTDGYVAGETNNDGEAKFTITRLTPGNSALYTAKATVTVKFGDIEKTTVIVL